MAGLMLCAGTLTGHIEADAASALGTVAAATAATVALVLRRSSTPPSDDPGASSTED